MGPTLDGYLLKEEEREAFEMGRVNNIRAVLVGNNTDEGGGFTSEYPISSIEGYRDYLNSPGIFGRFGPEALRLYPVASDADVPRAIADSFGDSQFYFGAQGIATGMTRKGSKVYRYLFTRKSDGGTGHDPRHSAEVPYVMGNVNDPTIQRERPRSICRT
jgi:para-nitrobenzyl esterase